MFGVAISLTFGLNITFNWGTPPMADYMFFFSDTTHPYFYIANYFYQLYLFVIIAIGGVAVEGAFILLTLFIEARFTFTRRLIGLLDSDGYEGGNGDGAAGEKTDRLRLIDTMIDVHSDVLGYVCGWPMQNAIMCAASQAHGRHEWVGGGGGGCGLSRAPELTCL